jgi:hypothetical protein
MTARTALALVKTEPESEPTTFRYWQAQYARRGFPTFPVRIDGKSKRPMVRAYATVGLPYSAKLADRFPNEPAFGLMLGKHTGLTVVDVDTPDQGTFRAAIERHGETPFVVRSGSGNWQLWYRHNGEPRKIRPTPDVPIDILGGAWWWCRPLWAR